MFLHAADRRLTGRVWHPSDGAGRHEYIGRRHLFAVEFDIHGRDGGARRVSSFPSDHA
ncbi:MAG TPA: hypothetical protein VFY45_12190 [Baekduia sp.]|nr:hypothetical protein [Baekduia sp.]